MLDDHTLAKVLTSMPGIGFRTGARILLGEASEQSRRIETSTATITLGLLKS